MTIAMASIVQMASNRSPLAKLTHTIHPPLTPPRFVGSPTSPFPWYAKHVKTTHGYTSCTPRLAHHALVPTNMSSWASLPIIWIEAASDAWCRPGCLAVHAMGRHESHHIGSRFPSFVPDAGAARVHGRRIYAVDVGAWMRRHGIDACWSSRFRNW